MTYACWFMSQLFHFQSSSLLMVWENGSTKWATCLLGPWTPVRVPKAAPNSCHQPGPAWPLWSFGKETSRQKTFLCSLALFLCNSAFKVNKWTFYPIKYLASYNNSVDKPTHPQSLDETKYGSTHLHKYLLYIITVGSGLEIESNLGVNIVV